MMDAGFAGFAAFFLMVVNKKTLVNSISFGNEFA
jgi:hypothetical protein